jgi:cell division protein FtsI (penicillin-binding protein 3)
MVAAAYSRTGLGTPAAGPGSVSAATASRASNASVAPPAARGASPQPVRAADALPASPRGAVLLAVSTGSMPDFSGKSLREVVEQATALGLAVDLRGSGVARRQSPPPGAPLLPGSRVTVEFGR